MPNQIAFYPQSSGGGAGSVTLISSQALSVNTSSVTFSSIPQTYTHLKLVIASKTTGTSNGASVIGITFNGDTGTNYIQNLIFNTTGTLPGAVGNTGVTSAYVGDGGTTTVTATTESTIAGYTGSLAKSCTGTSFSSLGAMLACGGWSGTAAITSITLTPTGSFQFTSGSVFSLYGIQ